MYRLQAAVSLLFCQCIGAFLPSSRLSIAFAFTTYTSAVGAPLPKRQSVADTKLFDAVIADEGSPRGGSFGSAPKVIPKTYKENAYILSKLQSNFIFQDFSHEQLESLVSSFERAEYPKGSLICEQGDKGDKIDYLYIVLKGECAVLIDGKRLPEPYGTVSSESMIGELASKLKSRTLNPLSPP